MPPGQQFQQPILHRVGILILVDHLIAELLLIMLQQFRVPLQQVHTQQQQIVKIDGIEGFEGFLITGINQRDQAGKGISAVRLIVICRQQPVFGLRDPPENLFGIIGAGIGNLFAQQVADQSLLIGSGVNRKILLVAEPLNVTFQQPDTESVKGRDHHPFGCSTTDHFLNPGPHLPGRLIGKGHRQKLFRRHPALLQEIDNSTGNHPSLAGTGTGQQQQGTISMRNSFTLLWIKAIQIKHRSGSSFQN